MKKLGKRRARYEIKNQDRLERLVEQLEEISDKARAAPVTDVNQIKSEEIPGGNGQPPTKTITRTKIKGLNLAGFGKLVGVTNETAREAILGPRKADAKDPKLAKAELPAFIVEVVRDAKPAASTDGPAK